MVRRMFARCILCLLFSVAAVMAIPRPDTKSALRGLTRLPRVEWQFSLEFDSDRGFRAFQTSKDPSAEIVDARARLAGAVDDGRAQLELAAWRYDTRDQSAARREFARAAETLRKTLEAQPGNARLRLDLASALHGAGRASEAESLYRESVKTAPRSATNWMALAAFLEARAWETAMGFPNWRGRRGLTFLTRDIAEADISGEVSERATRLLEESVASAQMAVRLAPSSPPAHHRLAVCIASKAAFAAAQRREKTAPAWRVPVFSSAALPELEMAAELEPENPIRLATAALWRALAELSEKRISPVEFARRPAWDFLSDETRHKSGAALEALHRFEGSSEAGPGDQALGTLRIALRNDFQGAADDLRNAVAANPDSEQAWETLGLALMRAQDFPELAAVCEARSLARQSARAHVLCAQAYARLGNSDRAEEEIAEALALNATDYAANLALANLLMRESTDEEVSPRVRTALVNAERAVRGSAAGSQLIELALAQSIYHGLTDNLDRAREILKAAQAYARDNEDVSAALNAIGY